MHVPSSQARPTWSVIKHPRVLTLVWSWIHDLQRRSNAATLACVQGVAVARPGWLS